MKVFLSSTYLDLIEHRKAVVNSLRTMGEEVKHMEIFGARDEEPTEASLEELDKCDVLVGVYAYRYGTVPKGTKTSVTEQEYLQAAKKGIPILVFVVDENHPWPPKSMDKSLIKINKFKSKATKEHAPEYFTSPDNLAHKVNSSIGRLAKKLSLRRIPDSASPIPYSPPKPKGSTLPYQPYFFGREKELATIADAISPDSRTWGALIDGPGGIGKTALAIRAAHLAPVNLFERKIFITAKVRELTPEGEKPLVDFSRDNYFSMLNELALELGEDGIPRLAPDERANSLRMAMAGKKSLIVFDNLETLTEDERTRLFQFLSRLPEGNKAILTYRRRADVDARVIRLDRLSANEALQLMEELAKNNSRLARENKETRQKLYEITNGNPLLIKWVCGQLGREGSAMHTIAEACVFIENAPKGNDPLEYIFGDLFKTFNESETKVLAALTHFSQPAKLKWIADMTGLARQAAETILEDLTDRSILIANNESLEFFLPPLAAHFIRRRQPETVNQTENRLINYVYAVVMENGGRTNYEGFKILEPEWPVISMVIPRFVQGEYNQLAKICDNLTFFLEFTGRWDDWILLNKHAEQKALFTDNKEDAGWHAYRAGYAYSARNELPKALACADRAEIHWQNSGGINKANAIALRAYCYELEASYEAAAEAYKQALDIRQTLRSEPKNICGGLNDLARAKAELGDYDGAKRDFEEALQIAKEIDYEEGITQSIGNLASIALSQEKWSEAESFAQEALALAEKIGRQELIATDCHLLAVALVSQGHSVKALPYAQRAVEIYTKLRTLGDLKTMKELLDKCISEVEAESKKRSHKINKK